MRLSNQSSLNVEGTRTLKSKQIRSFLLSSGALCLHFDIISSVDASILSKLSIMEAIPEASDPTRLALITRLALSTKKHDVDSTTYALVWLSDISQLEWMVDRSTPSLYEIQEILSQYKGYQLRDCIKDCKHCHISCKANCLTDIP
jgi:hypothetical protein